MSYFSQMVALTIHSFTSAAVGIGVAAALVRGIARHTAKTIGNFWIDAVRTTYYLLVPVCLVFALFLVSQGSIQNFKPYTAAKTLEPYTAQVPKTADKVSRNTMNAKFDPSDYIIVCVLVALGAFILGLLLGFAAQGDHESRVDWPQPAHPRRILP